MSVEPSRAEKRKMPAPSSDWVLTQAKKLCSGQDSDAAKVLAWNFSVMFARWQDALAIGDRQKPTEPDQ